MAVVLAPERASAREAAASEPESASARVAATAAGVLEPGVVWASAPEQGRGRESGPEAAPARGLVLASAQASVNVDLSGIEESQRLINAGGYDLVLDIVRPAGARDGLPAFMFVHGGGWVLGDYPTHRRLVRDIVVRSGFPAVFVNYTRTPEAHYPQPTEEVYAATR